MTHTKNYLYLEFDERIKYSVWPKMSNIAPKYGNSWNHYPQQDSFSYDTINQSMLYYLLFIYESRQRSVGLGKVWLDLKPEDKNYCIAS